MANLNNVEDSIKQKDRKLEISFDSIKNDNICGIVKEFYKILSSDKNIDLTNFKNNLKTLKIKSIKACEGEVGISVDALYDYYNNTIYYGLLSKTRVLSHELLHMASTVYDDNNKDVKYMGFGQNKHNFEIGMGLTEAYTELLSKRYFGSEENDKVVCDSYVVEMAFANALEKIIGKKEMLKYYFTTDLKGLINELKKYNYIEEVMKFIKNVDEINNDTLYRNYLSKNDYRKIIKDLFRFIVLTYSNKLKYDFCTNKISEKEFYKKVICFANELNNYEYQRYGKKYAYALLTKKRLLKIIKDTFGEYKIVEYSKC